MEAAYMGTPLAFAAPEVALEAVVRYMSIQEVFP